MALQQRLDLFLIFIGMNGACGVHQHALGCQQRQKPVQESLLLGQKTTNGFGRHPPTGIGVTGQGSQPRAGGIDQDPLEGFTPLRALLQKIGSIRSQGIDGGKTKPGSIGRNALQPSG